MKIDVSELNYSPLLPSAIKKRHAKHPPDKNGLRKLPFSTKSSISLFK